MSVSGHAHYVAVQPDITALLTPHPVLAQP